MRAGSPPNRPLSRPPTIHVVILDGTLSSLEPLCQTNAGRTYTLIRRAGKVRSVYYEPGLQWGNWRSVTDVITGKGINRQIRRAYGWLASRYRPGDLIYLFGYSRGAYAVRSLAGVVDRVGLLRADCATQRNITMAYRYYECAPEGDAARAFSAANCHDHAGIEMIGVWDTVKSLGINAPVLWRWSEHIHAFHNHDLSPVVRNGFHALAHDETRVAFSPVLWTCDKAFTGHVEQVWFGGAHGDVGGQLDGYEAARPLANIPLVWMLERAEACGLPLPARWARDYPCDPLAPARGTWRGTARLLMTRRRRIVGADPSERLHESLLERQVSAVGGWLPVPRAHKS